MKFKEAEALKSGDWVLMRDGRKGVFQNFIPNRVGEKYPPVIINFLTDPPPDKPWEKEWYSHNEAWWPASIIRKTTK